MKTRDITDEMVCKAVKEGGRVYDRLIAQTGAPPKVCWNAMLRSLNRGLIDCDASLHCAWLTDKGKALICPTA